LFNGIAAPDVYESCAAGQKAKSSLIDEPACLFRGWEHVDQQVGLPKHRVTFAPTRLDIDDRAWLGRSGPRRDLAAELKEQFPRRLSHWSKTKN
jgi:hypothetical protein